MKRLALVALLLTSPVLAQAQGLPKKSGSYVPSAVDHVGQDVQVKSSRASAASGSTAYRAEAGAKVCLDGVTSAACVVYELVGDVLRSDKVVQAPSFTSTNSTTGLTLTAGSKVCFNGATCTTSVTHNTGTGQVTFAGTVSIGQLAVTGNVAVTSYLSVAVTGSMQTCSSSLANRVYNYGGVPEKLCLCTTRSSGFKWINLLNPTDTSGTASSCPASPP